MNDYVTSESIHIFPCANRTKYNIESKLNTEFNYTHLGSKNYNESYVYANAYDYSGDSDNYYYFSIAGYFVKVLKTAIDSSGVCTSLFANIKLNKTKALVNDESATEYKDETTTVLANYNDDKNVYLDASDGTNYRFYGIKFTNAAEDDDADVFLQITDSDGNLNNPSKFPEIVHGTADGSIKSAATIGVINIESDVTVNSNLKLFENINAASVYEIKAIGSENTYIDITRKTTGGFDLYANYIVPTLTYSDISVADSSIVADTINCVVSEADITYYNSTITYSGNTITYNNNEIEYANNKNIITSSTYAISDSGATITGSSISINNSTIDFSSIKSIINTANATVNNSTILGSTNSINISDSVATLNRDSINYTNGNIYASDGTLTLNNTFTDISGSSKIALTSSTITINSINDDISINNVYISNSSTYSINLYKKDADNNISTGFTNYGSNYFGFEDENGHATMSIHPANSSFNSELILSDQTLNLPGNYTNMVEQKYVGDAVLCCTSGSTPNWKQYSTDSNVNTFVIRTNTGGINCSAVSCTSVTVNGTAVSLADHTHNYAGSGSAGGSANSAEKLNSNAGSATKPVYFSEGVPVTCTYELSCTVPRGASFTDTLNTVGASNSTSQLYLVGALGQSSSTISYSNESVYMTNGTLYATTFNASSDRRIKENIEDFTPTRTILDLPIKKYDYVNGAKNQIGCIAQDLQEICPEIVSENEKGYLSIQESKIVYLLLDEVKKLKKEVEEIKNK